jgi:hypothetical protein
MLSINCGCKGTTLNMGISPKLKRRLLKELLGKSGRFKRSKENLELCSRWNLPREILSSA